MFYLTYLKAELLRRWSKTLIIATGLAIASAIIITIISTSQGLSNSEKKVLNPLQNVGTDILVTRSIDIQNASSLDETTRNELLSDNRVTMDLSKLGKAGDNFSLDTMVPGSMITFATSEPKKLTSDLAKEYATGLILNVTHQEGTIPTITAEFSTGPQTFRIPREATGSARTRGEGGSSGEGQTFTVPGQNYRRTIETPQTNFKTSNYTIAGVDASKTDIGLILPSEVTAGTWFKGANQAIVNISYAQKNNLKVGDSVTINVEQTSGSNTTLVTKKLSIVGLVDPKLYTNTADIYLPLADLQALSGKTDRINIILIKATDAKAVDSASKKIAGLFTGAKVINSKDTASQVSGSLVSAANLMNKFTGVVSLIIILAAFIIVSLITIFSVNKRTQEIGTLKAIGWKNPSIIRQIFLESLVIGILGAVVGIGLGTAAILLLNHYNITFSANVASSNLAQGFPGFMRRFTESSTTSTSTTANLKLNVTIDYLILLTGAAVAILGSVVAGGVAAFKASRMKPQEALRQV